MTNWKKCSANGIRNSAHNREAWKQNARRPDPRLLRALVLKRELRFHLELEAEEHQEPAEGLCRPPRYGIHL